MENGFPLENGFPKEPDEETLRPWCSVLACRYPRRASPVSVSGTKVGCFLANVRSARERRPPTLIRSSVESRKGHLARISARFLESSFLIDSMPLGHCSCCIRFCSINDASFRLLVFSFWWVWLSRFSHMLPEVISSVAIL